MLHIISAKPGISLKRGAYGLLTLSVLFTLPACDDALQEAPKTVAVENFYNTADEVETATNAIYSPLRSTRAEQIAVLDAHTDWGYGRGSRAQYNDFAGLNSGNMNAATARWNSFYQAIRNANLVISNAPNGKNISATDIAKYVAEAKFLRALSYFDLVRNWGGVPIRTESNYTEIGVKRSTVPEVYELILADLTEAEKNLPDEPKHVGRPTKLAAKTMLADVYLTLKRYPEARDKANEVIKANKYSLVPVTKKEDFQLKLFGPDLLTTSEEIFYFKYARQVGQGNFMLWILNHPNTKLFNFGGAYAHYSDQNNPFYKAWDNQDIRKSLWDVVNFGLGATTLVSSKYVEPAAVSQNDAGNDLPIYRYAEVLLIFAEAASQADNGPTPEAVEALNQVHRRAYGQNPNQPSAIDFKQEDYNAQTFQDLVLQERAYEFIFEGKRWLDLKRTNKAQEAILNGKGKTIAEAHYLWPIPLDELSFNTALNATTDQNPGY
ncbi:RagB/SusD family nutrient uptake outer membrane protein [Adhaeribacter rhizoryzae]|uniref:RagB/SusD family nutrient uptake outer membrane protein n=1 Tax=Adhaeribacter rhizoryzae TaxID=2607907 RepID=A0A5M6DGZ1_9BACT|nr:RagB/SusD family nutrient uptake outer membrane protein [Adhaeribacter rhizoryzae]